MIHLLGIRHHGVGSGKMVKQRLEELQPDLIVIEGAPEIENILHFVGHKDLMPPLAIMLYDQDDTKKSIFYPFAQYSPEWVAVNYANANKIKVKAIDLPAKFSLNISFVLDKPPELKIDNPFNEEPSNDAKINTIKEVYHDPLSYLANIAGFDDSEKWWDNQFETNTTSQAEDHFSAVLLTMKSLREANIPNSLEAENLYREAYMRDLLRQAHNEMYQNIVFICGAWHAPALSDLDKYEKSDSKLLKQLPKVKSKISVSWIPWTNSRLSFYSGYGAGIQSPGWYDHLWSIKEKQEIVWLTKVALLFRAAGQDISTAHVLDTYKMAFALSQLRKNNHITLDEMNESIITVMCMGDVILLELIKNQMIIGDRIGSVPDDIPKVPLQEDFEANLKTFRLKLSAVPLDIDLDLRQESHLNKSIFFHRLQVLGIPWAINRSKRAKGTFKESWILTWTPEMMLALIDNAYLGNTIEHAANIKVVNICEQEKKIAEIVNLLTKVLPANLEHCIHFILQKVDILSTISADVQDIMVALPGLIHIQRYGDVRKSDLSILSNVIERLISKTIINLPNACYGLNDDISLKLFDLTSALNSSLKLTENTEYLKEWYGVLAIIMDKNGVHPILKGCMCRLLLDAEQLTIDESNKRINFALSLTNAPLDVAYWIEGFLKGSGMILIYDHRLWNLIYLWLDSIDKNTFLEMLPYLRRAFSKFSYGERKQIGKKARVGLVSGELIDSDINTGTEINYNDIFQTLDYLTGKWTMNQ